ncbi:hypothetical protein MMC28_005047 [Mycoblastus sanguinarius]|nr:hypothetical protein [Mycoblastus sanguinarius]
MNAVTILSISLAIWSAIAQNVSPFAIFNQTGRLPAGCIDGYDSGQDTVIYTVPYAYAQVLSIIGSYKNLTWSGNRDNTVSLNGTDNTVGTARNYENGGANVTETITVYNKPLAGPDEEVHTLAPLTLPAANISFYASCDGTTVTPTCSGAAIALNFTISFCATNTSLAASILHLLHLTDTETVGVFLGNQNYTTCAATNSTSPSTTKSSNATSSDRTLSPSSPSAVFRGGAGTLSASAGIAAMGALVAMLL